MRAIRGLLLIALMLVMAAVPVTASTMPCHASAGTAQSSHEHHHAMSVEAGSALALSASSPDHSSHKDSPCSYKGCFGLCCFVTLDVFSSGFPTRIGLQEAALPLPADLKSGEIDIGLPERPPRLA